MKPFRPTLPTDIRAAAIAVGIQVGIAAGQEVVKHLFGHSGAADAHEQGPQQEHGGTAQQRSAPPQRGGRPRCA